MPWSSWQARFMEVPSELSMQDYKKIRAGGKQRSLVVRSFGRLTVRGPEISVSLNLLHRLQFYHHFFVR